MPTVADVQQEIEKLHEMRAAWGAAQKHVEEVHKNFFEARKDQLHEKRVLDALRQRQNQFNKMSPEEKQYQEHNVKFQNIPEQIKKQEAVLKGHDEKVKVLSTESENVEKDADVARKNNSEQSSKCKKMIAELPYSAPRGEVISNPAKPIKSEPIEQKKALVQLPEKEIDRYALAEKHAKLSSDLSKMMKEITTLYKNYDNSNVGLEKKSGMLDDISVKINTALQTLEERKQLRQQIGELDQAAGRKFVVTPAPAEPDPSAPIVRRSP